MIDRLPIEIKLQLLKDYGIKSRPLKYINKDFYKLFNLIYKDKFFQLIDKNQFEINTNFKNSLNQLLSIFNQYLNPLIELIKPESINWEITFFLLVNRKFYFNDDCFIIQSNDKNYQFNSNNNELYSIKINSCQSFQFLKTIYLPSGFEYDFQIKLKNYKSSRGLGTTNFQIELSNQYDNHINGFKLIEYPPIHIHDMLPIDQSSILKIGSFKIPGNFLELIPIDLKIEELGMYPKINLEFEYIEFRLKDFEFLFYSVYQSNSNDIFFEEESMIVKSLERSFYTNLENIISLTIFKDINNNDIQLKQQKEEDSIELDISKIDRILEYYKSGERIFKLLTPFDQKKFKDHQSKVLKLWKLPFKLQN
ncbi:hypothetical protein WICMUC_005211 [Wickerhamomyces mucosus]|uniref:Uncharacterized protein n=1 Tax=Wickerhamomyces mucosus TaxID=1378264 RepID=A0A9P8P9V2_9ASCO|nr:hypothetical protein WICMUC_005211 [Wickerhamomyces mucosus]